MTAATKQKLIESEHCPEIREAFYRASDGLIPLAEKLKEAGLEEEHLAVLEALRALDRTDLGVVL